MAHRLCNSWGVRDLINLESQCQFGYCNFLTVHTNQIEMLAIRQRPSSICRIRPRYLVRGEITAQVRSDLLPQSRFCPWFDLQGANQTLVSKSAETCLTSIDNAELLKRVTRRCHFVFDQSCKLLIFLSTFFSFFNLLDLALPV